MKATFVVWGVVCILAGLGGGAGYYFGMPEPVNLIVGPLWLLIWVAVGLFVMRLGKTVGGALAGTAPAQIRDGVTGVATLVGFQEAGMRMRAGGRSSVLLEFVVDVALPGQAPYRVSGFRAMWPEIRFGMLRPGTQIAVKVDRTNPQVMAFDFDTPAMGGAAALDVHSGNAEMAQAFGQLAMNGQLGQALGGLPQGSAADLLAHGTPARASIASATPTGTTLADGRLLYAFTLQVWPAGSPQPFEAAVVHAVPPQAVGRTAPGSSVPVAFDPRNPTRVVAIDWNRP